MAVSLAKAGRSVVWDAHEDYFHWKLKTLLSGVDTSSAEITVEAYFRSALADVDANSAGWLLPHKPLHLGTEIH